MNLSFKRIISTLLLIAMVATSHGFNSYAMTLSGIINVEVSKNQEKNKGNAYKYYKEYEEAQKLLMNGDDEPEEDFDDLDDKGGVSVKVDTDDIKDQNNDTFGDVDNTNTGNNDNEIIKYTIKDKKKIHI